MANPITTYPGDGGWYAETRVPRWGVMGKWNRDKATAIARLREYVKQWEAL